MYVKPHFTLPKETFWHSSDEKSTRTNKIGSARIDFVVNDFALSVPNQNFTRARTYSRGSPSTDKIGTRS